MNTKFAKPLILASGFVLSLLSGLSVSAEEYTEKTVGDFTVHEYSTYVEIAKYNNKEATSVTIPAEIDGLPVISIGPAKGAQPVFITSYIDSFASTQIESIELPNTLISIGSHAFSGCNLKQIIIPDSVLEIKTGAFENCKSLESVKISNNMKTVPSGCFRFCSSLNQIQFPDQLNKIENYAFQETAISELILPDTVKEIEFGAFYQCEQLKSICFPKNIEGISSYASTFQGAFENCTSLKELHISANMIIYGDAFKGCSALEKLTIEEGAKHQNAVFDGCKSLKEVVIPASFKSCPSFNNCTSLESVTFSDGVTATGSFQNCINLTTIDLPESISGFGNLGLTASFQNCAKLQRITIRNPKCIIYDSASSVCNYTLNGTPYFNGTIYGADNSTAQSYAEKYGYRFTLIGSEPEYLLGDFNDNGDVDVEDAQAVLSIYTASLSGKDMQLNEKQMQSGNVNGDQKLDVADAQLILLYYVKNHVAGNPTDWETLLNQ